jgi:pimeloyl-ACP methyl ester carboxylesterase
VVLAMASTALALAWKRATVDGRPALYGVVGEGPPVVFLHGWGLGYHAYRRALKHLAGLGMRVLAPALPGFGGTADLPARQFSMAGYAAWVAEFLRVVKVGEPVFLVGHSFGGGVAIKVAHDFPERVRALVLVNSIGAATANRPLWDWGIHFPGDIFPVAQITRVLPVILEDALPNLLRNPRAMWRVAQLARRADLTPELEALRARGLPVAVVWGDGDRIIPRPAFEAICAAVGAEGAVVNGTHSWLLADPAALGEVMTNVIGVAELAQRLDEQERRAPRRPGRRLRSRAAS